MKIFFSLLVGFGAWIVFGVVLHFAFPLLPPIPGFSISERAALILCTLCTMGVAWAKLK